MGSYRYILIAPAYNFFDARAACFHIKKNVARDRCPGSGAAVTTPRHSVDGAAAFAANVARP